jgi:phosphotriesterase-related protein
MPASVMTVLGEVDATDLGLTLTHEHIYLDQLREYRRDGLLNDPALARSELEAFREAGGRTIVDCTSEGLGRDPLALRAIAERTGLHVVMGSGHYRRPYIDVDWLDRTSTNGIADAIVRDIEEGVQGTGVRAGIIGEIGHDRSMSAVEERVFRAAARAHLRTGLTITTHAARWPVGPAQVELLRSEGVPAHRIIVGHCDTVPVEGYLEDLVAMGVYVQLDTVRGQTEYDTAARVESVLRLFRAGLGRQVLVSHDVCLRSHLRAAGGTGYSYVPTVFRERLLAAGMSVAEIGTLLVDNPRAALTGER